MFLSDTSLYGKTEKNHEAQSENFHYIGARTVRLDPIQGEIQGICKYNTCRRKRIIIVKKENRKKYT